MSDHFVDDAILASTLRRRFTSSPRNHGSIYNALNKEKQALIFHLPNALILSRNQWFQTCAPLSEIVIIFFAALLHGALGLGFPMTSTPLLAWHGSLMRAIQLTLIPTLGVNILMIARQSSPWQALRPFITILPAMIAGTLVGSFFILYFDPELFRILLAMVILMFLWLDYRNHLKHVNPDTRPRGIAMTGLITGVLVGTVNAGVPVLIIFSLYNRLSRAQSIVLFNSCFLTAKLTQIALFGSLNILNYDWQKLGVILLVVSIVGVLAGQWLGKYLNQARWRAAMRWVLLAIAISLLYRLFNAPPMLMNMAN